MGSAWVAQEAEGASSSLSYSDKATADLETNMSIGLLSMAPFHAARHGAGIDELVRQMHDHWDEKFLASQR
jgi:hypothetical protein